MIAALHDFSGQRFEVDAQSGRRRRARSRARAGDLALVGDENRHGRGCIWRRRTADWGFLCFVFENNHARDEKMSLRIDDLEGKMSFFCRFSDHRDMLRIDDFSRKVIVE